MKKLFVDAEKGEFGGLDEEKCVVVMVVVVMVVRLLELFLMRMRC